METASTSIRFSGDVCGGLRTHELLTFRITGTAVVVASPTTEDLLVATNGKVCMILAPHIPAKPSSPILGRLPGVHAACIAISKFGMQVSCLDVFKDGSLLAMGTSTTIGVPADIYVWDVHQRKLQQTLSLHKV